MVAYGSDMARRWLGSLLLALQLVGPAIVAAHAAAESALPAPDHAETPGSHGPPHNDAACPACRFVDLRFVAVAPPPQVPVQVAYGSCDPAAARSGPASRPRLDCAAPRAPPSG
jgi:hypothetical protein